LDRRILLIGGAVLGLIVIGIVAFRGGKNEGGERAASTQSSPTAVQAQELYKQAAALEGRGEKLEAREAYQKILTEYPDYENIEAIQNKLSSTNMEIIFSNLQTPDTTIHEVASGDTLGKLAKQYNTTVELIKISNNLKNDVIRIGQRLRIWTGAFSIFVDKSQNILLLRKGDEIVKVYHVSTGQNNSTPTGTFSITTKLVDPVWFKSGAVIAPDSPENELGSRWLGFDMPGYGIHGTIRPDQIGQQATAGCVRMVNQDVEELYTIVPSGTQVTIVD
jgi:lipoprotein-anchoring transpeptidase ErfK/SrfK